MSDRRQLILIAAGQLIEQNGWQKTTISQIARAAKVGVGTVYLEFASKDAIIGEMSARKYKAVIRAMRRATMSSGSFAQRLAAIFDARTEAFAEIACSTSNARDFVHCACPGVQHAHADFERAQRELLHDFLEMGRDAGEFDFSSTQRAREALLITYSRFTPPHLLSLDHDTLRSALGAVHELVLSGILTRGA